MISRRKEEYQNHLALKSIDPMANAKIYWSILETFYNAKKVPIIHPLLIDNKIISDFEAKANYFNNFFMSQCTPLNNNSKIPENQIHTTNSKLSLLKFDNKDIINPIGPLNLDIRPMAMIIYPSEC